MKLRVVTKQHIFEPGRHFPSCHASTLARLPDGDTLAAWFAGTREGHVDVGIWTARLRGGVWQPPVRVARDETWPCWNPVLHVGRNGEVYLYYKVGQSPKTWRTMLAVSRDNGMTFLPPYPLVDDDLDGRGPVKNKITVASTGRWLAPGSTETDGAWDAFADLSDDAGETWRKAPVPLDHENTGGKGVIQPTIWESSPGMLHMFLRSTNRSIYRSDSRDNGETWSPAYPTDIPNNNSGIDAVKMENGPLALIYNPVGEDWGARTPICCALLKDNGSTIDFVLTLDHVPPIAAAPGERVEFSYPAVIAQGDRLFITYTWMRRTVEYVELLLT